MSYWEMPGQCSEWLTPAYVFNALGETFDLDVAHPNGPSNVPCTKQITKNALTTPWNGFVWMNPPFGGRNGIKPWLTTFFEHRNGIALAPDRTSAPWCQNALRQASSVLFVSPKIKFIRPDGSPGPWPSTGTILFAAGPRADAALLRASRAGLGCVKR